MKFKRIEIEKKYGVPIKEILATLYGKNYYSYKNIANFLEVDSKSIRNWAKEMGIESRSPREAELCKNRKKISPELLLRQLAPHLALCICPQCQNHEKCIKEKSWHERGFCVMVCEERI